MAPQRVAATVVDPIDTTGAAAPRRAAMRTRVYVGMWSTHLRDLNRGLLGNSLIGLAYRGYYAATFINSFGDRAVAVGIQRSFSPGKPGWLTTALGYRVGLLTGYDERLFGIGHISPLIPFGQIVGNLDCRNLGVELAYAGVVATVTLSVTF
ncbi:MAG: hypothetical protein ACRENP_28610 [Longimicrobiales bacterium]